jgi:hypothetical protein
MMLRLMIYDRTCRGLTRAWSVGGRLYGALGRLDDWRGVATWREALDWLVARSEGHVIAEIQFWGHGQWGCAWIDRERLDVSALVPEHPLYERLVALAARLAPSGEALWWFRTCGTFGAEAGQDFARAWSRFFGCRTAGHTHEIGFLQSGLHELAPGAEPTWSEDEGRAPGVASASGAPSSVFAPNTITCLHGAVPSRCRRRP